MRSRRWRFYHVLRPWSIAPWLLLMVPAAPTSAQSEINVTVYYVSENEACRPHGYLDSAPNDGRVCEPLDYEPDVVRWKENRGITRQSFIFGASGPEALRLQDSLRRIIHQYTSSFDKLSKADHRSSVFVFDFGSPVVARVSLTRRIANQEMRWERSLDRHRRWIVHHEARWLHPFNQTTWKLEVDGKTWSFHTQ